MKQNRTVKLLKETIWFGLGSFGSKILYLILIPFYTNILTLSEYGTIDIITTTVNLILPLFTLSIYDAAFRFLMDEESEKNKIISLSLVLCCISSIVLIPMLSGLDLIAGDLYKYKWYFWGIYFTNAITTTLSYCMKGIDKSGIYAIQGIIYTFVFAGTNIIFLSICKLGISGYLLSIIFANFAAFLYMFTIGKTYKYLTVKFMSKKLLVDMLKYCLPLIPSSIAWWIMTSIDKYMLLYMCDESANGLYNVAHKIPTVISVFTTFFISAWQISVVRNKDDSDSAQYFSNMYEVVFLIGCMMGFCVIAFSQVIGELMYAKDFYAAWVITPPLTVATVFSTFSIFLGAQFTANKRSDLHLKANVMAMILNIILNYFFIKTFGIGGAAYGTMVSYFAVLLYRILKIKSLIDFKYKRLKHMTTYLLLIIAAMLTAFNVRMYFVYDVAVTILAIIINYGEYKNMILNCKKILKEYVLKNKTQKNNGGK